ncbi:MULTISPECIES: methyltransferase [Nitrospirillum]|uniref:Putative TPR repeat methyltransferase n=1 Tax=Nitrospirillum amazonense TaxID=28077 RepID=A0A560G9T7_9PROT|nr:methyltransferase [Nitrospirillum amazonense]MEC4593589.1 methyltransferase [Nitrospirillum amazonense]TWB30666.1 putative TPR repeat methyltransferase [Nitrospirillum amazonense]
MTADSFPDYEQRMVQAYDALDAGDEAAAEAALMAAVALAPDAAEARGALGALLRRQGRFQDAGTQFAAAAAAEPERTSWALDQAGCLADAGDHDAAWALVSAALARRADDAAGHRLAARLQLARGGKEAALAHAREARFLAPHDLEGAIEVGQVLVDAGDPLAAVEMLEPLLAHAHPADPARAGALVLQGRAWAALAEGEKAARCWRQALEADPEDAGGAARLLAALEAATATGDAGLTPTYVKALFDRYADRFDTDLTRKLHYQAPQLLRQALDTVGVGAGLDVLDIGCGTGLGGVEVKPLARFLAGVDLSPRMVEHARARGLYDRLWDADLMGALAEAPGAWDLVLAADVLVYLGDLAPVFQAAADALKPGGRFAATVERWSGEGPYALRESRRYAHAQEHVLAAARGAGLEVEHLAPVAPRWEKGRPVDGLLFILRKSVLGGA